jgi:acetyl-CoA carboxylase biotin carboxyl carrier protein
MSRDLPLTADDVTEIVAILDGTRYERIDVTTSRFRLRVARSGEGWTQEWDFQSELTVQPAVTGETNPAPAAPARSAEVPDGVHAVRPPLPGTFYRAPQPGAPPFVEIGSTVDENTVVGIMETMKLMTPIHAAATGVVTAILIDNGTMIEADTVLMHIAPAKP